MGSSSSKISVPRELTTPMKIVPPNVVLTPSRSDEQNEIEGNLLDPRSPHICRTPMNKVFGSQCPITKNRNLTEISAPAGRENPSGLLKAKLIKELNYNLLDPRSPSQFIDRTPIKFDENDDLPVYVEVGSDSGDCTTNSISFSEEFVATVDPVPILPETPKVEVPIENERDPRSPSGGVERTPIIFADEIPDIEILDGVLQKFIENEIENKPLERVKNPRGRQAQKTARSKSIYEDKEQIFSSPKRNENVGTSKRTPLSCVANKSHLRSKSVENSTKSAKGRIALSSYDDYNLKTHRDNCGSGESFQQMASRRLNI